jgi:hypothetical protein
MGLQIVLGDALRFVSVTGDSRARTSMKLTMAAFRFTPPSLTDE